MAQLLDLKKHRFRKNYTAFQQQHMQTARNDNGPKDLRIVDKIFGADLFLQSREKSQVVARNMNIVAFLICFCYATYLLLTGIMTMTFLGIFTCYLPSVLCIATDIILRKINLFTSMVFTFISVPVSLTLKGLYEPLPGLMLFPFIYGIVCFFLLPTNTLIYLIYSLSSVCFVTMDVAYHYKYNHNFKENISLIIFNDLIFSFVVYTVLGYLQNLLSKFRRLRKMKEQEMVKQNLELQAQQEEIASQNKLLQYRNQLLIDSWHFQQKITSVLTHDTRTSLIFLKHILLSSKRMKKSNPEITELLSELDREISNMTGTFENVLQWLKHPTSISTIHKEEIFLHDITEEIIFSYKGQIKSKEIVIVNEVLTNPRLYINREYMRVIMRNIVGNAIKFSKKGGTVKIWASENDQYSQIYIEDAGVGISPINLKKINEGIGFSTQGTLKETGTGMGLVFCRDFIEKSGGKLEMISTDGKGTTVIVTLAKKQDDIADNKQKTENQYQ